MKSDALAQAIALWSAGHRISVALAFDLAQEGFDVATLERIHRRR